MEQYQPAVTEGQVLDQRIGERLYHMTLLPEEVCYALKNMADPLFFVCLTKQHTLSGQVIGNGLVLALPVEEGCGD